MREVLGKIINHFFSFFQSKRYSLFAALIWTLIIILATGIPGNSIPKVHKWVELFQPDKLIHFGLFGLFSLLWLRYLVHSNLSFIQRTVTVLIFGSAFGVTTELLQHYVFIGRNANIPDGIADIIGVILGIVLFNILFKKNNIF